MQVLNTALPSTIASWVDDYNPLGTWSLGTAWYATGGTVILTALVGDFLFINLLIDLVRPDVLFLRRFLAPRARTQRAMNALYKRDADIYVAFRLQVRVTWPRLLRPCSLWLCLLWPRLLCYYGYAYYGYASYASHGHHPRGPSARRQLINKMVVVALIYGTAFPALYGLGFLFCLAAHWIDRYNLLRRFAPPPPTSDRLIAQWLRVVVPCSILLHMTFAVFLFRGKDAERGGGATAPPTVLAYATAAIFGPLVLYFMYREWNLSKVCARTHARTHARTQTHTRSHPTHWPCFFLPTPGAPRSAAARAPAAHLARVVPAAARGGAAPGRAPARPSRPRAVDRPHRDVPRDQRPGLLRATPHAHAARGARRGRRLPARLPARGAERGRPRLRALHAARLAARQPRAAAGLLLLGQRPRRQRPWRQHSRCRRVGRATWRHAAWRHAAWRGLGGRLRVGGYPAPDAGAGGARGGSAPPLGAHARGAGDAADCRLAALSAPARRRLRRRAALRGGAMRGGGALRGVARVPPRRVRRGWRALPCGGGCRGGAVQARALRAGERRLAAPATQAASRDVGARGGDAARFCNASPPRRGAPRRGAAGAPVAAAADAAGGRALAPPAAPWGRVAATVAAAICRRRIAAARKATAAAAPGGRRCASTMNPTQ